MTERYEFHDEHGRIAGYVLREVPNGPRSSVWSSRAAPGAAVSVAVAASAD